MKKTYAIALLGTALAFGSPAGATAQTRAGARAPVANTAAATPKSPAAPPMPKFKFENFTTANGLPDNHVFSVLVDGDRIWAGTENGLAVYENGAWKTYTIADGLAHRA